MDVQGRQTGGEIAGTAGMGGLFKPVQALAAT